MHEKKTCHNFWFPPFSILFRFRYLSGTYQGTFYGTDTVDATMKISRVGDMTIRMDVTNSLSQSFIEISAITKNSTQNYTIFNGNPIATEYIDGYYQDGLVHIYTTYHDYVFEGNRK